MAWLSFFFGELASIEKLTLFLIVFYYIAFSVA
jgi:hypothetical protein